MSDVWIQVVAGLSGVVSTLAVKYLEHVLTHRKRADEPAPQRGAGALSQVDEA